MISNTVLVLCEAFADNLDAERVGRVLARGIEVEGQRVCDLCVLRFGERKELDDLDFDRRMRAARAVVIATPALDDRTLAGSAAFEVATRARQSGVPAYAVTAHDGLDPFEARILDLQVVLEAGNSRELSGAGRKLAAIV